jgi:two-component sensor histidine kinase
MFGLRLVREDVVTGQDRGKDQCSHEGQEVGHGISRTSKEATPRKRTAQDIILILVASVVVLALLVATDIDVFEILSEWSQQYEPWELDEIFTLLIFLAFALTVFSLRRWRELREEVTLRERLQEELVEANEELETRVEERTAELVESRKRITAQLKEREALLSEIHHRVKNNLAVIVGLLDLRSYHVTDPATQAAFREFQDRIHAMALAHEMIYQSENLAEVNIGQYLGILMDNAVASVCIIEKAIDLKKEVENISFGLDVAIPLGILVTELVSNSFKHAFPEQREGEIRVSLECIGEKEFQLIVADNGIGMPEDVDPEHPQSLGLDLVHILAEELDGEVEFSSDVGTHVRVRFKEGTKS